MSFFRLTIFLLVCPHLDVLDLDTTTKCHDLFKYGHVTTSDCCNTSLMSNCYISNAGFTVIAMLNESHYIKKIQFLKIHFHVTRLAYPHKQTKLVIHNCVYLIIIHCTCSNIHYVKLHNR